jgi:hypothetical protein
MSIASRDKMISFRVSKKDYERLRAFRLAQGVRSISELARVALDDFIRNLSPSGEEALAMRVNELEGQLRGLALELKHLKQADG